MLVSNIVKVDKSYTVLINCPTAPAYRAEQVHYILAVGSGVGMS